MKKTLLIVSVLLCLITVSQAQTTKEIAGYYSFRGGSHFIKEDGTFMIIGYGTLIIGKWTVEKGGVVNFVPDYEKEAFTLYGRHNSNLKDTTRFMLSNGFSDEETLLRLGTLDKNMPDLKRIFRPDHHCISYPYVYGTALPSDTVSFSAFPQQNMDLKTYQPEIYTFYNDKHYNDFVAFHYKDDYDNHPFSYLYKDGRLYYNDKLYGSKEALPEKDAADLATLTKLVFSPKAIYLNPRYNTLHEQTDGEWFNLNYRFDANKNAYLSRYNYEEGEENQPEFDYNNLDILYQYDRLTKVGKSKQRISIEEAPIFEEHCPE